MERSLPPLEVWAGVECTHNRVHNRRFDQLSRTGHRDRLDDLDRIAALGVRTLRYPVLWEHVYGDDGAGPHWSWVDDRLSRLRELGIRPVVGLLHHGAGPGEDGFQDPSFPERFAAYAREVAERFPWVDAYIPINEPLTTARFAGLYGVWHPHALDVPTFARIALAQIRGTILAIRAIRDVVPTARFIQNEDIGTVRAVPRLLYQADYENERRWLTFDLLCGTLRPGMTMWEELVRAGVAESELAWFANDPLPPEILACDNYITSDRILDDRMDRYPERFHGTNGRDRYADVEAVRVTADEPAGILPVLREAWNRYGRPLAVGEAHMGSTREEQLRWLRDTWSAAHRARSEGTDVRAVTVWSLFGAYDWNTLVTEENGFYEPGAFDVRDGRVRPTAIASMIAGLANDGAFDHPALDADGWWRRAARITYTTVYDATPIPGGEPPLARSGRARPRTMFVAGRASPMLAAFLRIADVRGLPTFRERVDAPTIASTLTRAGVWAVIEVAPCPYRPGPLPSARLTVERTLTLARATAELGVPFLLMSCQHAPRSSARARPCARSAERERAVLSVNGGTLVIRAGDVLGPWDPADPLVRSLAAPDDRPSFAAAGWAVPAFAPDVINAALDFLVDGAVGTWRVDHGVRVRWDRLADSCASLAHGHVIEPVAAPLGNDDATDRISLPTLVDALSRFVQESEPLWRTPDDEEPAAVVELDSGPAFGFPATEPGATLTRAADDRA